MNSLLINGQDQMSQLRISPKAINDVGNLVSTLKANGITPEQAVRQICKERGINVDELLSMIK